MKYPIYMWPHEILNTKCSPVDFNTINEGKLQRFVSDLFDAMYRRGGIGIAAPQVGVNLRLFVVNTGGKSLHGKTSCVFINPTIEFLDNNLVPFKEGCLSIPTVYAKVWRPQRILIRAQGLTGEDSEFEAGGLLSRVIQHEADHLDGKLFIQKLSKDERKRIRSRLRRQKNKVIKRRERRANRS